MSWFRRISSLILIVGAAFVGITLLGQNQANAFSNVFFDVYGSVGAANVSLVNENTRYVQKSTSKVRVWFPNNNGSVTIKGGHWCSSQGKDYIEAEDGSWSDFNNGDRITKFSPDGYPGQVKYGLKCPGSPNADMVMSFSNLPVDDQQIGYYFVDITISYVGSGSGGWDGVVNYFNLVAEGQPNVLIGSPGGTNGYTASIEQTDTSPVNTDYRIPFGRPCNETGSEVAAVAFYDLDNDGGSGAQKNGKVTIRVHNDTDNNYVNFNGAVGTTWTPVDSTTTQSITFNAGERKKYTLEINNVYWNNTIQYSLPYAQIFHQPCPPPDNPPSRDHATVEPTMSADSDAELGSTVTFTQAATVTDFPELNKREWGYNEVAIRRAVSTGTNAYRVKYSANMGAFDHYDNAQVRCGDDTFQDDCAGHGHNVGTSANPDWRRYHCDGGAYKDDCGTNYKWQCSDAGITRTGDNGVGSNPQVDQCKLYRYFCRDNSGAWRSGDGNQAYNGYTNQEDNPGCNNRWRCPSPSTLKDWSSTDPNLNCHIYRCAYDPDPDNYFFEPDGNSTDRPQDDFCQRRCSNGAGAPPQLRAKDDYRCYVRPSFNLRCAWSGAATGVTSWETVNDNGAYCVKDIPVVASSPGSICLRNTPEKANVWIGQAPGNAENTIWTVQINPASKQACATVFSKPYFNVLNGDANAAAYAATGDPNSTILAFNSGKDPDPDNYLLGSTASIAVLARGVIDGFASHGNQNPLDQAVTLTFAGAVPSGKGYGGGFDGITMPNYWKNATGVLNANTIVNNTNLNAAQPALYVEDHDVYINGDITTATSWTGVNAIKGRMLVVKGGNIYIQSNVTKLDGMYVALKNSGGNGGNIYTCDPRNVAALPAPALYSISDTRWKTQCKNDLTPNPLQVNGSLIAQDTIKMLRLVGSVTTGPAAESVTYSPEMWLRYLNNNGGTTDSSLPANAFTTLPPVL